MKITRFEDLECWQEARKFVNLIYEVVRNERFNKDYRLMDQITGAAVSVMNNIVEGFASQSNIEFVRFLRYSRRSVSEVQSCLYVCLDQQYIEGTVFKKAYEQGEKTRQVIDGLIRYLRTQRAKRSQRSKP